MEPTGYVRRVDELGRVVVPKELRDRFGIADGDQVEIWVDRDQVVLAKHVEMCVLCGSRDELVEFKGKRVCGSCRSGASARPTR